MRVLAACALAIMSFAAASHADPIDFDSDAPGPKPEPFTSVDSPLVHFYDTIGNNLLVLNPGPAGNGTQALAALYDFDASGILMRFDQPMAALWFDFGNDNPSLTQPGDVAILKLFDGFNVVGYTIVPLNRNGSMDQTIGFVGDNFDSALFYYGNANLSPFTRGERGVGLVEVIDNVNYRVPEPSLLALSGLGGLVVAWRRRRKTA